MMHESLKGRINRLGSIGTLYTLWMSLEKEGGYFPVTANILYCALDGTCRKWGGRDRISSKTKGKFCHGEGGKFCRKEPASGGCCRLKKQPKVRTGTHKGSKWRQVEHIEGKEAGWTMLISSLYFKTIGEQIHLYEMQAIPVCWWLFLTNLLNK